MWPTSRPVCVFTITASCSRCGNSVSANSWNAREKVDACVQTAVADGGKVLLGGRAPEQLPNGLFYEPTLIVDVEVERERPELLVSLKHWIAAELSIQEAWYVTGEGDYVLIITARDVEEYDALMKKLVAENANVRRFQTRVALGTLKRGQLVPMEAAPG